MNLKSILKKISKTLKGQKELTPKESQEMMSNLINKNAKTLSISDFKPGTLLTFKYNAKDKSQIYDKTPFVMVIKQTSKYVLGVNFHWAPVKKRLILVEYILKQNSKNIRNNNSLKIKYHDLKGALNTIGMYPVIRLYIKKRISSKGIIVPDELIRQAAKMKSETFTQGRASSTTLWSRAVQKAKTTKRKLTT